MAQHVVTAEKLDGYSTKVRYGDLDLSRADHMTQLRKRVNSAAYRVCVVDEHGRFVGPGAYERRTCHTAAMSAVEPQLLALEARARDRSLAKGGAPASTDAAITIVKP